MKIYSIKMAFRGVSPMVWRRLRISGDTSLACFHYIIQAAYGWDNEYLHQFHIYGKDYGIGYIGGMSFSDNAHKVYLGDFEFDMNDKFTYEYNFFKPWLIDIRVEDIKDSSTPTAACCTKGSGMPGASKYDEAEPTLNLFKAIVNADKTTTFGDLRPLVDALNAVRFNRHLINQRIQTEHSEPF